MKCETKKIFIGLIMGYIIITGILMIASVIKQEKVITFKPIKYYQERVGILKARANMLNEGKCKDAVKKLIDNSNETYFTGDVSIKEISHQFLVTPNSWLSIYTNTATVCKIKDLAEIKASDSALAASIQYDNFLQKYIYDYELTFNDLFSRKVTEAKTALIENKVRKNMELETINLLITEIEGKYE